MAVFTVYILENQYLGQHIGIKFYSNSPFDKLPVQVQSLLKQGDLTDLI